MKCEVYAHVTKHGTRIRLHMWPVTKHGDQCLSPVGVNWVSDGAGIDFIEMYAYEKCSLFIQSRVASNRKVLRKKWIDLMKIQVFQAITQARNTSHGPRNILDKSNIHVWLTTYTRER